MGGGQQCVILNKVSITEKLSFEQRLEGEEGVLWWTIDLVKRNSQCKTLRQSATWCVQQGGYQSWGRVREMRQEPENKECRVRELA